MSMEAQIHTDATGNIIVHMKGGLDFGNTIPLRRELEELINDYPTATVTLDMNSLDFVGSSGISYFVETLKLLSTKSDNFRLSNVKSEFMKVFKLYQFDPMALMEAEFDNDETETINQQFGNRKRTFQN